MLLRVMVVIKSKIPALDKFPSFFYKNALFQLHERYPDAEYWTEDVFANRSVP